ncbi:MAG: hypothetical protein JW889_12035 [Verrucomicrobia bacterium]|nr:hypothetical protein [Verrucomicrobiota bacterium]
MSDTGGHGAQTRTLLGHVSCELRHHVPFTGAGALTGIVIMIVLVLTKAPTKISAHVFHSLHPLHVVLSAMVTTAMYKRYGRPALWLTLLIGYTGSIGIATLSDVIMPFWGGRLLGVHMHFHLPFVETDTLAGIPVWILINGAAVLGIMLGLVSPKTKLPHAGHVLLSTWASLFGLTGFAVGAVNWLPRLPLVFVFLFLAVWLPCCMSDIVYPLLWVKKGDRAAASCHHGH